MVVILSLFCPSLHAEEAQPEASENTVIQFQGVGNKSAEIDPKLYASEVHGGRIQGEKESTITLSPGMQKVVDGAGKTIKNIDSTMLDSVNHALQLLHLEAENAKIRPRDSGVGLGISIKLNKGKNRDEIDEDEPQKSDSDTFYEAIAPSDSQH